jgi:hypothetical protein
MKNVNPQAATAVTTPTPPLQVEETPTHEEILLDHIERFSTDMYTSDYIEVLTDGLDAFCNEFFHVGMVLTKKHLDLFHSRLYAHTNLCKMVVQMNDYRAK